MIAIGSTLNQRFTLDSELGRGGMGAVYRATDQVLGRTVAIKVLKELSGEDVGRRIRLEAQILARLAHDNVVRLYDFGESEGLYFLVMEEVDGPSYSRRRRSLGTADRLRVVAEVAEALDYAHHQGVIHRDVKPANVLLTAADRAKLSDFGLSMMAEASEDSGQVRGTPHYMSPEQARGKRLDYRTDLYSLGVMLYESATGTLPFSGQSLAVIAQHVNAAPPPPRERAPGLSRELEALIVGLLEKDPAARPQTGTAVALAIREELARGVSDLPESPAVTAVAVPASPADGAPEVTPVDAEAATVARVPAADPAGPTVRVVVGLPSATAPAPRPAAPAAAPPALPVAESAPPLVREMIRDVLAVPVALTPEERYLAGHYLAFLLGGAPRRGLFLRRPDDPKHADRARFLLAMAWLSTGNLTTATVAKAAELLESKVDVRPSLNPVVVVKYIAGRDTPAKRKRFRVARKQLLDSSGYAQKHMLDARGVFNPGLMPQAIEDLYKIAPERHLVDDQLAERWNRVAEVWRSAADFRDAVLRYATKSAHRDPASASLWPEVVYPLIERARWQRRLRPRHEAMFDYLSKSVLRRPDAGVRLDRLMVTAVPRAAADDFEEAVAAFAEEPRLADDGPAPDPLEADDRLTTSLSAASLHDLTAGDGDGGRGRGPVPLSSPDPYRFTQGDLKELWKEALAALGKPAAPGNRPGHRTVSVGPYRLVVIPSVRGRSAGQVALQGMPNKQVEMLTPSLRGGGSSGRPVVAVWVYRDASALITYLDFKSTEKSILWHAPTAQQHNFEAVADLNHMLYTLGLELPDQFDKALSRWFRPRAPR